MKKYIKPSIKARRVETLMQAATRLNPNGGTQTITLTPGDGNGRGFTGSAGAKPYGFDHKPYNVWATGE